MNWDGIFNCRGLSRFLVLYLGKLLFMVVCFFFPALVVALKHRRWRRSPGTMINHNLKQRAILSASEPTPLHFLSTISTQLTIYQKIQLRCFSRIMLTLNRLFSPFCFFIFFIHLFPLIYLFVYWPAYLLVHAGSSLKRRKPVCILPWKKRQRRCPKIKKKRKGKNAKHETKSPKVDCVISSLERTIVSGIRARVHAAKHSQGTGTKSHPALFYSHFIGKGSSIPSRKICAPKKDPPCDGYFGCHGDGSMRGKAKGETQCFCWVLLLMWTS